MRRATRESIRWLTGVLLLTGSVGCGGGGDTPSSPSPGGGTGGGGSAADSATITITSAGVVSPSSVTIRQGGRVTFVNNHSRPHDMFSDPHPTHEECPPMNEIGFVAVGQSRTSGAFTTVRTCGFHDHNLPADTGLQGRITIVAQ